MKVITITKALHGEKEEEVPNRFDLLVKILITITAFALTYAGLGFVFGWWLV